ncbi:2-isopropylmalate synthase [Bacilliculturomica massiliensis]|uniref:2-isopropylmalate synthase n=1 Tax=Bacilliculturomica massiliensis TaxID=1917867 RepID=UPI00102F541B|nr:2-isopropylmalate synthase [Bacilliculturomica massiliensis]
MKNSSKYKIGYFMPPSCRMAWTKKNHIEKPPVWCSVDLRDGNQALVVPMSLEEKLEFFQFLIKIGFKEIEVGFPAASETEYELLRTLIEQNMIPDDVTIQVLTQSREHIIRKTFESLAGIKKAIVHLYNSTSVAQREQVFRKPKEEIIAIAKAGAELFNEYAAKYPETDFRFEYSPESFTGTEMEFALDICNEVIDIWKPTPEKKVIINLPATVSMSMPHVYANQIEYMSDNLHDRENVIVSIHPHNDRGTGVADAEMGMLAGADRVEGTLFGNGERTGNVDIVTLAMNMYCQGVDPGLDFSDMPSVVEIYEKNTRMRVPERQPYGGKLVFAAFSGSHQDAIAKGMKYREENDLNTWTVPYLPIDPKDVGREYETDVIRINSQSGKGGIGYILEQNYGYILPPAMKEEFGYYIKDISDNLHQELSPDEICKVFTSEYVNFFEPIDITKVKFQQIDGIIATINVSIGKESYEFTANGNGRLDAVSNALKKYEQLGVDFDVAAYTEHALENGSSSRACAYVAIKDHNGHVTWGTGIHPDIISASVNAFVSAVNRALKAKQAMI